MKNNKNKTDEFFSLEDEKTLDFGKGEGHHPDALTPDEILNSGKDNSAPHTALKSLLKKIQNTKRDSNTAKTISKMTYVAKNDPDDTIDDVFELVEEFCEIEDDVSQKTEEAFEPEKLEHKKSLLDKCMPYIIDENGNDASVNKEPLYKLASVAEILNSQTEKTVDMLYKQYGIFVDKLTTSVEQSPIEEAIEETQQPEEIETAQDFQEVEEYPSNHTISDIDIPDSPFYKIDTQKAVDGGTVTFTPITATGPDKQTVVVSTHTKPMDFTGELLKVNHTATHETETVQLEKSDFEEYTPKEEFIAEKNGKAFLKKFANKKKTAVLTMWGSILLTLLLAFFEFPFMSDVILSNTRVCMIIASAFTLLNVLLNISVFTSFAKIFTPRSDSDINTALAIIAVSLYAVFGIISGEIILNMLLFLSIILSFCSIGRFLKASANLRSFKQINNNFPKQAITLIDDPAINFAMTKGVIEGDTLTAAPKSTTYIEDYIKYSTYGVFLNGKINIITVSTLLLSVLTGILAATHYNGLVYGFYSAAAIQCLAAIPTIFLVDALPLYGSSIKLARVGAMLAGKMGAKEVEQANAIVLNSKDIFPAGTVTLHRMQVLSENNLEDTIIRAASLTQAMQSPLAPIFKKIAGESNIDILPDSDTVKYEEALGISGWVDNRLLFIGNRTLMESHGISVPPVDVDRKILREGYFPVYVASQNKACALLVVRYDVDPKTAKELRRLTATGLTVLVKTSDPNLTEEMICDYLGLYEGSVKVMSAAGCHIYVNTVLPVKYCSAPAAFKTSHLGLTTIINCANRIKVSNIILTASYIIAAVFGILLFAYTSFSGSGSLLNDSTLLLYGIISTVVSYLLYITQKP